MLGLSLALGLLIACGTEQPRDGWQRLDLCENLPTPDSLADPPQDLTIEVGSHLLGGHLRHFPATEEGDEVTALPMAGAIPGLEAATGVLMRWDVELGKAGYFAFRPLSQSTAECPLLYRVGVITEDGTVVELLSHKAESEEGDEEEASSDTTPTAAPKLKTVDLAGYAGQKITLLAAASTEDEACATEPRTAIWGSPALYHRVPPERTVGSVEQPNIVLIGLDTVPAATLGVYGREPSPTPAIDALAAESDVWLEAFSTFNVTNPSFTSILTGLYGKRHGVYDLRTPLPEHQLTLSEILKEAGYDTSAILSARHLGHRQSGLGQGFDDFVLPAAEYAAETVVGQAMTWIETRHQPFFLWLHLFDPHTPHTPPEPFSQGWLPEALPSLDPVKSWAAFRRPGPIKYERRYLGAHEDLFFGELAYTDQQIGQLMDFLQSRGLLDRTMVVLLADHGENMGDHGIEFRHSGLWDSTTHVPLMIRWPGSKREGRRIDGLVQTLDIFPTVLQAVGIDAPPNDGEVLVDERGEPTGGRRLVFAEHSSNLGTMVRSREHLYVDLRDHSFIADGPYLYDLATDPEQEHNLAEKEPEIAARLRGYLDAWLADRNTKDLPVPTELDAEDIERLKSLGYAP